MLNVRKLKQDFSAAIVKEGKQLFDGKKVLSAKILHLDANSLRISAKVLGQYNNTYETEVEIDRKESEMIDSDCNCPYHYDCQHLAAVVFFLSHNLDQILVNYSKENNLEDLTEDKGFDETEKEELLEAVKEAESKEERRKDTQFQKELIKEYIESSELLAKSPFFLPHEKLDIEPAELAVIFSLPQSKKQANVEVQLALRLASRSKPLHISNVHGFLEAMRYKEPLFISGKLHRFSLDSFNLSHQDIVCLIMDHAKSPEKLISDRAQKTAFLDIKTFGLVLAKAHEIASKELKQKGWKLIDDQLPTLPCLYEGNLESPIHFSKHHAEVKITLEYIHPPTTKILLNPTLVVDEEAIQLEDGKFFECASPGIIYNHVYYRFHEDLTRQHLRSLVPIRNMAIPEPLFGTFVENALPELSRFALVDHQSIIDYFVTLPYVGKIEAICNVSFLDGELEAKLSFCYGKHVVPASFKELKIEDITSFVTESGVIARNLVEEKKIIEQLFQDFHFNPENQTYVAKTEKKIIEFMTDVIPRSKDKVTFKCPQNLLEQFIYDKTRFSLKLAHTDCMHHYEMILEVKGALKGASVDQLWDCVVSRRSYLELSAFKDQEPNGKKKKNKVSKILVLDLNEIGAVIGLFDELGIDKLENHTLKRPLWNLANIDASNFTQLPVSFKMTPQLKSVRKQMLGETQLDFSPVPKSIQATLRHYQMEGVEWLERLRLMYLNGILADDMGLGKTLQAIVAMTQLKMKAKNPVLVVCPTSLLYNWQEECHKFNPDLTLKVIDGMPGQRKKLISNVGDFDIIVTSYSLLQKDVEEYSSTTFSYVILDEAQHIKNRSTRNAKSVKLINAEHRMILSGTPIENSLDELWSLFDFLMPGFLGTYDRYVEKYVRVSGDDLIKNLKYLRQKVAPFILRRMKTDVLDDLPPVNENVYHTQLTPVQRELYTSYAKSAKDELTKLVERDGFDKVQIHILATLTRLKQICCHPAIFAKEVAEPGDSAKYDMLIELLQTLIEGEHKTVIFSQYTRMLQIMREDFIKQGIRFCYLDGSSKNRLEIVKQFNEDKKIPVFLVSLKAGGTGLNLVGADTVIHYDMWWNPAVESQATDRVHRMGQKESVSVYKLVTLGTIEEKIVEMQNRKKGIVKKIVSCDDEAITKLTWEDVLELLRT